MLFLLPLFQIDTYISTNTIHEQGLKMLRDIHRRGNSTAYDLSYQNYIEQTKDLGYPLIYLSCPD